MDSYNHKPLANDDTIRLVELLPGLESDPLTCNFAICSLSTKPQYEALSYVWGDPQKNNHIRCDGYFLAITTSLYEALVHLRWNSEPRRLWVDAISINQVDYEEKAHQVSMMSNIYASAANVIIWLGPEKPDTGVALKALDQIVTHCLGKTSRNSTDLDSIAKTVPNVIIDDIKRCTLPTVIDPNDGSSWSSLRSFFTNPWFQRIWVVQEVGLGNKPAMIYGHQKPIKWGAVLLASIWLNSHGAALEQYGLQTHRNMHIPCIMYIHIMHCWVLDPSSLLAAARQFEATELRDKIYALIAFRPLSMHPLWRIIPDYRKSLRQVYTEAATSCILQSRNLGVLSQVDHEFTEQKPFLAKFKPH
jgi:hypothetical protein